MEEKSVKLSDGVAIDVIEGIARICHETNRVYCQNGGDDSQVAWEKAPQWQKDSTIMGVRFVIDNQHAPASANHDSWMAQKLADGWKYGEVKDEKKKEHPCIVPYEQLPLEQQLNNSLFRSIVLSFAGIFYDMEQEYDREQEEVAKIWSGEQYEGQIQLNGEITNEGLMVGSWSWAWDMLKKGYAMRLPSWKGYWMWDNERQCIVLHTKDGKQIPFNEITDWVYTLNGMADMRWEMAEDAGTVELNITTMPFSDALRYIKQGAICGRKGLNDIYGVFIRPEDQLPHSIAVKVKSIDDNVKRHILGAFEKMHFGRMISAVTCDGRIIGWNPTDDDLLANDWEVLSMTYDQLVASNAIYQKVEENECNG